MSLFRCELQDLVKDMRKSKAKHDWSLEWPSGTAGYAKPVLMRMAEAPNNSKVSACGSKPTSWPGFDKNKTSFGSDHSNYISTHFETGLFIA